MQGSVMLLLTYSTAFGTSDNHVRYKLFIPEDFLEIIITKEGLYVLSMPIVTRVVMIRCIFHMNALLLSCDIYDCLWACKIDKLLPPISECKEYPKMTITYQ